MATRATAEGVPQDGDEHHDRVHVQPREVRLLDGEPLGVEPDPGQDLAQPALRRRGERQLQPEPRVRHDGRRHHGHRPHEQAAEVDGGRRDAAGVRPGTQHRPAAVGHVPLGHEHPHVQGDHQEPQRDVHLLLQRGTAAAGQRRGRARAVRAGRQLDAPEPDVGHAVAAAAPIRSVPATPSTGSPPRYYGDSTLWRNIAAANGIKDPLALVPGTLLAIPERSART